MEISGVHLCRCNKMFANCGFETLFLISYIFGVGRIKALQYLRYVVVDVLPLPLCNPHTFSFLLIYIVSHLKTKVILKCLSGQWLYTGNCLVAIS